MIGGVFSDHSSFLLIARFAIIGALLVYLLVLSKRRADPFYLWLILAGAAGNVIDMCCYGHVVDFIHLRFFSWSFPVFNIADSCITIGACLLFLCSQKQRLSKCGAETE
jgi:signal peptidase II